LVLLVQALRQYQRTILLELMEAEGVRQPLEVLQTPKEGVKEGGMPPLCKVQVEHYLLILTYGIEVPKVQVAVEGQDLMPQLKVQ
jgi:hypothetical protein